MATTTTKMSIPSAICAAINAAERALSYTMQVTREGFEVLEVDVVASATFDEGMSRDCFLTLQIVSGGTSFGVDVWVLLKKQNKWNPVIGGRWIPERLHIFFPGAGGKHEVSGDAFRFHRIFPFGLVIVPDKSDKAHMAWTEALSRR